MADRPNEGCCGKGSGCCGEGTSRRQFLKLAGLAATAALADGAMAGSLPPDLVGPGPKPDAAWMASLTERGQRKVYSGAELETLGMPCGGIAAGQLYVRGDGTLAQWWIANSVPNTGFGDRCYRTYRPPSPLAQGFAIRVKPEGAAAVVRKLCRDDFDAIEFIGEYPIAEIRYRTRQKPALPVEVTAEVFSPFIPLNARDSAMPVTVLAFKVKNTSAKPAEAAVAGWLQNGVCLDLAGRGDVLSRNRVMRGRAGLSVQMDLVAAPGKPAAEAPRVTVIDDFEDGTYGKWTLTGDCFGPKPAAGTLEGQQAVSGWQGKYLVNTFLGGDGPQGTAVSKPFKITEAYLAFLIGGGSHAGKTCLNLRVGDKTVRTAAGKQKESLEMQSWDVREFLGQEARLEIVDRESGPWGHINVDYIHLTNVPPAAFRGPPEQHPGFGDMAITAMAPDATAAAACASEEALLAAWATDGRLAAGNDAPYPLGAKRWGAAAAAVALAPGEEKTLTFLVTWYFPNRPKAGRMYENWFKSSVEVADYAAANFDRLSAETHLFRDTYFDTTLPYWLAARLAMPVSILATETCQWWKDGRFYAWEGVGCCAGTCTHVWNYEHASGRLFPELARSTRLMQDLGAGFDEATGLVGFRGNRAYAADGQCGTLLKIYREHLMSADRTFLDAAWPKARKAMDFLLAHDGNDDGLIEDVQHNTFDINFVGPNTFVGSLYLAALRAAGEMARLQGDPALADRYRAVFEKGRALTCEKLWNGEYFVQTIPPGQPDKHQYGQGCMADQVFGQGWAHQLGLGYIYPRENVAGALAAVYKHNWTSDVGPYNTVHPPQRWFARPGEAGLFTCSWPKGGRPAEPVLYRDEVWTGIEYQVANHMIYEGMVREALAIVRGVHERYDGARHNPWNEVECGDHYARAMASWGCLLAAAGYTYDGPAGRIGFAPRLAPEDFKAFFTAAEGWGSLVQKRAQGRQTNRIEVKWGRLRAAALEFEVPDGARAAKAAVTAAGRAVAADAKQDGPRVALTLAAPVTVNRGEGIEVVLTWP
ncbi:MAG: hypothetical protein IMZ44_06160 [Planctomycetes bacterium]|nr:hypothetical protein [Planctomycetota bacterium]